MQYRTFGRTGDRISVLGFGCMRFPTLEREGKKVIDEEEAIRMLRYAIDEGVNYIDTAYPYHDGQSEPLVGKALRDGYRQKVFLATKSPVWALESPEDFDRILTKQLERLETGCIDYYLLHALDRDTFENKVLRFGLIDKIKQAKHKGLVRHIGFSFHDEYEVFQTIVDACEEWDFCQIQLNYIDTEYQAGLKGLHYAARRGLGVVIMEPLLGGRLAVPPVQVEKVLPASRTSVEWALDYLWNLPEVAPVLSGMSTMQQIEDNLRYADKAQPGMLSSGEVEMLREARRIFRTMALVPCTKCGYCMPCPAGIDIPKVYEAYNMTACRPMKEARAAYDGLSVGADACVGCGQCENACPQHIAPGEYMTAAAKAFGSES